MKKAIDNNGLEVEVPLDTPVKTIDGVHYLLHDADHVEIAAREAEWQSQAQERALQECYRKRTASLAEGGYGTDGEQKDLMFHEGFDAWRTHIAAVKQNIKLP